MFKKHLISLVALWSGLVLGFCGFLCSSSGAKKAYHRLMNESHQVKKEALTKEQRRYHVSRQMLYRQGLHRMQSHLMCDSSRLIYSKGQKTLVEHFEGLTCLVEEKEDSMVIESGEAQYDGKHIALFGQVVVQHGWGEISARRLSAHLPSGRGKKRKHGFLRVSEEVHIQLKGGGQFFCQQGELDEGKMEGVFSGNATSPEVIYLNPGRGNLPGETASAPFELNSHHMILKLARETSPSSSSRHILIKEIEAHQHVRMRYDHDYLLLADDAVYQHMPIVASPNRGGLLTLTARDVLSPCQIITSQGDHLYAERIEVNTIERTLGLSRPTGTLRMPCQEGPPKTLEFSANELFWDHQQQYLRLKGEVRVFQKGLLNLKTDINADRVCLSYQSENQQFIFKKITLEGDVCLMSRPDGSIKESGLISHCALADRVECFPEEREMILTGENGNRVLFFDQVNHVQMSAPSLKVHEDMTTKKETIQGLGDVRFTFLERELEHLNATFHHRK